MTISRIAARNITIVGASHVVMWLAAFVFTLAQARYLGPVRFGELSLALGYAGFLAILIDFGLGTQLSRMIAQGSADGDRALGTTMVVRAALWLLAVPVVWLLTVVFRYPPALQQAILVLSVSIFFVGMGNAIAAYLQGREEFLLPSLASIAQRGTAAAIGLLVLVVDPEIAAVACAFVVGAVVNLVVLLVGLRVPHPPRPVIDRSAAYGLFRSAVPLGVFWFATTVYGTIDLLILERLAPPENVGWYAAAYRLFTAATLVPTIVAGMVLFPVLSRLSVTSRDDLADVIEKGLTFLMLVGGAVGLMFALFAESIVAVLYPAHAYAPAASALRLLAPGLVFGYANSYLAFALFALKQERRLLVLAVVFAVLNPLANVVAIPFLAQDGAALITTLTELGVLIWLWRLMPADLLGRRNLRIAAKVALAAAAATLVIVPVRDQALPIAVPLALAAYAAAAFALRVITPAQLRALRGPARAPVAAQASARPFREEVA